MDVILVPSSDNFDPTFFYVFVAAYFLVLLCAVFYAVSIRFEQEVDIECGQGCHVEKTWLLQIRCTPSNDLPPPSYLEAGYGTMNVGLQNRW